MKAIEIAHKEFPNQVMGGYQRESVREYLSRVADLVDELNTQLQATRQQAEHLKQEAGRNYRDETTIARVMLSADQLANRLKQEAEAEIQMMREMAGREAERIRLQAQAEAEMTVARARAELQRLEMQASAMRTTLGGTVEQAYELLVTAMSALQNSRDLGQRFAASHVEALPEALPDQLPGVVSLAEPEVEQEAEEEEPVASLPRLRLVAGGFGEDE